MLSAFSDIGAERAHAGDRGHPGVWGSVMCGYGGMWHHGYWGWAAGSGPRWSDSVLRVGDHRDRGDGALSGWPRTTTDRRRTAQRRAAGRKTSSPNGSPAARGRRRVPSPRRTAAGTPVKQRLRTGLLIGAASPGPRNRRHRGDGGAGPGFAPMAGPGFRWTPACPAGALHCTRPGEPSLTSRSPTWAG